MPIYAFRKLSVQSAYVIHITNYLIVGLRNGRVGQKHLKFHAEKQKSSVRPGIIYLSRIPPYMKPLKVRQIFSEFGEVGRVFLQPEGILLS